MHNTDNHPEARQRGWKRTLHLKDLLSDDESPENARRVAGQLAARLKRVREYEEGSMDEFTEMVDEIADIQTSSPEEYQPDFTVTQHLNACLSALYDWADAERVWIA